MFLQSALVADLVTMLLLSLFISRQTAGSITSFLLTLTILPLGASVYGIFRFIRRRPALRRWAVDDQTRARAALVLLALFCVTTQFTGAEPIVGSFLAGMLISATTFAAKPQVLTYCRGIGYGF
ncbi:hypothetical protein GCM10025857_28890 [Alicyclobacillus contaminans]|nr:hypothetical protein GCM10025857_28890 [Alicyclobacillus contaminans]